MLSFLLLLFYSCTDHNISQSQLLKIAQASDPSFTIILPKTIKEGVHCSSYGSGCITAKRVQVDDVQFIVVQFIDEKSACANAQALQQFCFKNWLFDEVRKEPIALRFVKKAFLHR